MNSKEETNSEATNLENESLIERQNDPDYINEQIGENKLDAEQRASFLAVNYINNY